MHTDSWKKFENRICKRLGGKRRGADYKSIRGGNNDCIGIDGFSVEIKVWEHPYYQMMLDETRRAEEHRDKPDDIPLAIIKRKGDRDNDALVIFRLETFEKLLEE